MGDVIMVITSCTQRQDVYGEWSPRFDVVGTIHGTEEYIGAAVSIVDLYYAAPEEPPLVEAVWPGDFTAWITDPAWSFPDLLSSAAQPFNVVAECRPPIAMVGWLDLCVVSGAYVTSERDSLSMEVADDVHFDISSTTQRQNADGTYSSIIDIIGTYYVTDKYSAGTAPIITSLAGTYYGAVTEVFEFYQSVSHNHLVQDDPAYSLPIANTTKRTFNIVLDYTFTADKPNTKISFELLFATGTDETAEKYDDLYKVTSTLYISPDLGWASRTRMLNPVYNSAVRSVDIGDLEPTNLPDLGYISVSYPVVTIAGQTYLLPDITIRNLIGNGRSMVYSSTADASPHKTILRKSTGAV